LAVDDAHGVGVLGAMGKGSCAAVGVKPQILVVTFGKAFGLSGAAILCQKNVGDYLSQFARHHVYSTAIPPAQAHAIQHAAHMLQKQDWRREKLQQLQSCFDQALADQVGFVQTNTPIKPMICGSAQRALWMAECLKNKGFWVTAIRPPTVEADASRIRITLTANHSIEQVQALAAAIIQINRK
jgi:8-amino-7-oxononanoate synthase